MVRYSGPADGTQINRIEAAQLVDAVLRHELAALQEPVATPIEMLPVEREAVLARRGFQHLLPLGHDLLADAVAGNDGDFVFFHREPRSRAAHGRTRTYTDHHGRVEIAIDRGGPCAFVSCPCLSRARRRRGKPHAAAAQSARLK
jgi:hypothetical protein